MQLPLAISKNYRSCGKWTNRERTSSLVGALNKELFNECRGSRFKSAWPDFSWTGFTVCTIAPLTYYPEPAGLAEPKKFEM